ncbi:ryanodine receptor 3-like isoform X3 [Labeo rohita]|uniref:Ryanodine receptor 3-like isoform X3 n=1 Tax=Labeo rohita TaxID=84645 RepID=A0A498NY62_LABRO|nr:ryanodine receptor 3-like isoform X3 [Labeo rohita]
MSVFAVQVEPSTKLFPAVFVRPTSSSLFQFELAKIKNAMPISSAIFKSEHKNPVPQCPPRLDVQTISSVLWSRMPNIFLKVETARMCELLHYFCDCELRHRIEAIVSFSDSFVSKLQFNQKFRYNELMLALNMSAAVTAKKTKEFRSPPQEQINMLLNFNMGEDCPCPADIQEELYDFHGELRLHCEPCR